MADPRNGPQDGPVAANLSDATANTPLTNENAGHGGDALTAEVHEGGTHTVEATAFGLDTTGWVALASLVVLIILLVRGVPKLIGATLDSRIADIRRQLDDAKRLRAEAETLKAEYEGKAASAHADAERMRAHAHNEAHAIIAKAKADAEALMARRAKMAEDRIAAAERQAMAEVRATAAEAAVKAAALLMRDSLDARTDRALVDRTISGLGRPN
jgi:F-type H+-transporting ATPase subunit b